MDQTEDGNVYSTSVFHTVRVSINVYQLLYRYDDEEEIVQISGRCGDYEARLEGSQYYNLAYVIWASVSKE